MAPRAGEAGRWAGGAKDRAAERVQTEYAVVEGWAAAARGVAVAAGRVVLMAEVGTVAWATAAAAKAQAAWVAARAVAARAAVRAGGG